MTTITIGADSFEIHGTEAGARAYFNGRLNTSAWDDAGSTERKRALITAAQWLERFDQNRTTRWTGTKTSSSQTIPWPRDGAQCNGEAVPDGTTPADVITAEYELALALLDDATVQEQLTQGSLVKRVGAGSASVEFFGPSRGSADDTPVPAIVWQLIGCFMTGSVFSTPTVTGNTEKSEFLTKGSGIGEGLA